MESWHDEEALVRGFVRKAAEDARVVAVWLEGDLAPSAEGSPWPEMEVHLALTETGYASFYAQRWNWLADMVPLVHTEDRRGEPHVCLAVLPSGVLVTLALEVWGSVPERSRGPVRILFDRSGTLERRLVPRSCPERLDFPLLDRLAARFWLALLRAVWAWPTHPITTACFLGDARRALAEFILASKGLTSLQALEGAIQEFPEWVGVSLRGDEQGEGAIQALGRAMATGGRQVARMTGWKYPEAFEAAVRALWTRRGREGW